MSSQNPTAAWRRYADQLTAAQCDMLARSESNATLSNDLADMARHLVDENDFQRACSIARLRSDVPDVIALHTSEWFRPDEHYPETYRELLLVQRVLGSLRLEVRVVELLDGTFPRPAWVEVDAVKDRLVELDVDQARTAAKMLLTLADSAESLVI